MTKHPNQRQYHRHDRTLWDPTLLKQIARVGLPMVFIGVLFSLTEVIDNISLGVWAPKNAIGIVNFAGRLYWIVFLVILLFPAMFGFLVAQYYGARQYAREKEAMAHIMFFNLTASIIGLIIVHVWGRQILPLFIKRDSNYDYYLNGAYDYVRIFSYLMLLESVIQTFNVGVAAEGKTRPVAIISVVALPLNFLLNYIFMKVLGLGTNGCAWSTLISWFIVFSLLIIWVSVQSKRGRIHFGFNPLRIFRINLALLKKGLKRIGSGLSMVSVELAIVLVMTIFSRRYSEGIIVTSIINPFFNVIMLVGTGVAATKAHFVGTKLGAGQFQEAYDIDVKINFYVVFFGVANSLLIMTLAYPVPLIYTKQSAAHKLLATYCLLATAVSYPVVVLANSFVGSLEIGGKGNHVFAAKSAWPLVVEVGMLYLIAIVTPITFLGLYIVYRALRTTRLLIAYLLWRRKSWITNETKRDEIVA